MESDASFVMQPLVISAKKLSSLLACKYIPP